MKAVVLPIEPCLGATSALLLAAVQRDGVPISADLRIAEKDAAHLLGYAAAYLKAMRQEGRGPTFYLRGMNGSRITYRIADLASWIESARENQ